MVKTALRAHAPGTTLPAFRTIPMAASTGAATFAAPALSKYIRQSVGFLSFPPGVTTPAEVDTWRDQRLGEDQVIVGVGIRLDAGNTRCIWAKFRKIDPATGHLRDDEPEVIEEGLQPPEAVVDIEDSEFPDDWRDDLVMEGIAVRAAGGNPTADVKTLVLWTRRIQADGSLGPVEGPHYYGEQMDSPGELHTVPPSDENSVLVSIGFGAKPGNITHLTGYYARLVPRVSP